jgi:hypothetical protein
VRRQEKKAAQGGEGVEGPSMRGPMDPGSGSFIGLVWYSWPSKSMVGA